MSEYNEKLDEIKEFLLEHEGADPSEVIADILGRMSALGNYSPDEISLMWDDEYLIDLDSFANDFFDELMKVVANVIDSYKE